MAYNYSDIVEFSALAGKIIRRIEGAESGSEELRFVVDGGETFALTHFQDCCETVSLNDIAGDISDLLDSPVVRAEERSDNNCGSLGDYDESYTWTFYELATIKGSVTLRWYGTSNGYYSESVDLVRVSQGAC